LAGAESSANLLLIVFSVIRFTSSDGESRSQSWYDCITRQVPRDKLPAVVGLPILPPPGLFHDQLPAPITTFSKWEWQAESALPYLTPFLQTGETCAEIQTSIDPLVFARLLAKIAHAASVGWISLESFKPFLPPLILGEDDKAAYLVGGAAPPTAPSPAQAYRKDTLHHRMEIRPMSSPGKPDLLADSLRLFLHIGSPTYWVIVGELLPVGREKLTLKGPA
jgi:hypothetical protein